MNTNIDSPEYISLYRFIALLFKTIILIFYT